MPHDNDLIDQNRSTDQNPHTQPGQYPPARWGINCHRVMVAMALLTIITSGLIVFTSIITAGWIPAACLFIAIVAGLGWIMVH